MKPCCHFTLLEWYNIILPLNSTPIPYNSTNSHGTKTKLTIPKKRQQKHHWRNHKGGWNTSTNSSPWGTGHRHVWLTAKQLSMKAEWWDATLTLLESAVSNLHQIFMGHAWITIYWFRKINLLLWLKMLTLIYLVLSHESHSFIKQKGLWGM